MHEDDESPEPAAAALAEAADALSRARRAQTERVVDAYRTGVPLARIARYSGLHPIALRHLLAAAGEPPAPAWPEQGGVRPQAADRDGERGIPARVPAQSPRGADAHHAVRPAAAPHGGTVMAVLLGRPGRLGGLLMLFRCPQP